MLEIRKPKVSVLMPAYNAEDYIDEAITSILKQSFEDFEFIITDDASTDSTWKIISKYAKKDKRIRAIKNEHNLFIAKNRNKLISLAAGEYILWADADDISLSDRIDSELKIMEADPAIGICGGDLQIFDDTCRIKGIRKYATEDSVLRKQIFRFTPVAQPACMIRRNVLKEVGSYDLEAPPAEDLEILFRIGTKYKFANVGKVVIKYRDHPRSATYTKLKKIEQVSVRLRFRYLREPSYEHGLVDVLYNITHWISIWVIPTKIKIAMFNRLRNTKPNS